MGLSGAWRMSDPAVSCARGTRHAGSIILSNRGRCLFDARSWSRLNRSSLSSLNTVGRGSIAGVSALSTQRSAWEPTP
jgi:hypothetical protein